MQNQTQARLIAAGAILFLIGLFTGFAVPAFKNPRMGLASHLEGVMNGTFLIALGAAWSKIRLSPRLELATFWSLTYGSFANWFYISAAAVMGTSKMTPIAGEGFAGSSVQELFVSLGLVSVGVAMLVGGVIVVFGVCRPTAQGKEDPGLAPKAQKERLKR